MILALMLAVATVQPLAIRVEMAPLGRGPQGTVMGVAVQVAPEDRARAGPRVRVSVALLREGREVERREAVVALDQDGSALLYREWAPGGAEVRVRVTSLAGDAAGVWRGEVVVPVETSPFEAPDEAGADAVALAASPPPPEAVRFRTPERAGGIGAVQLEVEAPGETSRVEFSRDGAVLVTRNRAPWTVSVDLGEVARRTTVRATAFDAKGRFLGEDAVVINAPAAQLAVEILVHPVEAAAGADRAVTVAVTGRRPPTDVVLQLDEKVVARWNGCPCTVTVPETALRSASVLTAEAKAADGTRGEAVRLLGGGGFFDQVRVEKVELPVVVVDASGRPVSGLARESFTVLEDGAEVAVEGFGTTADLPLALGVAVDSSGSMEGAWPQVRRAVAGFASGLLRPGDETFLLSFAWDAKVQVPWTREPRRVGDALDLLTPEGGTSLHDAVIRSLETFRGRAGRRALVLLTDGDDTTSRTGWDVALRFARTTRIPVFPIGLRVSALDFFLRGQLRDLAAATGGEAFFPGRKDDLAAVYSAISEQLRSQYLLTYVSPSRQGADHFRTVTVRVAREGLSARTIAGYYPSQ